MGASSGASDSLKSSIKLVDTVLASIKSVARLRKPSEEIDLAVLLVKACAEAGATSPGEIVDLLGSVQPFIQRVADPA